jgi:hypothetical protein
VIAGLLAGAWRSSPPPLECSPEALTSIVPLLLKSGAGALAWWRLRDSALADTAADLGLRDAYRLHTLEAEVHAIRLREALARLDGAGVDTLVVKGWAIARAYPEPGLRPYSDHDLVVRAGDADLARKALAAEPRLRVPVDLHVGPGHLDALSFDALWARSEAVPLGRATARVLAPEDHLRVLALHALRHGIFRPPWLVDLGVALEARPAAFDWVRCLGPDPRRAEWVTGALALAHRLLGARVDDTPAAAARLPDWLVRAVLRHWDRCEGVSHRPKVFRALVDALRDPRRLREEVRLRWDRPIQATLDVRGPFNALPRWPFQVAASALRAPDLVRAVLETARPGRRRGGRGRPPADARARGA